MKIPKCPRCGFEVSSLVELWEGHSISFDVDGGKISEQGNMEPGYPVCVSATCSNPKCAHNWTVRKATQISDFEQIERERQA